ncbi:MAG TPA: tol-pal system protein YbgF [Xanthomonadales bacterium]|nr:tol-pal system protein YbgF [Xanthomonadales bacterium]
MAAVVFAAPAFAQGRLSLSERITRLEQQVQGQGSGQSTVELLNRINELQSEVQSLRGLVEQQSNEIEQLKKRSRDQYVDLDARLTRLEGGAPAAPAAGTLPSDAASTAATTTPPSEPLQPGQLAMEEPEVAATPSAPPEAIPTDEAPAAASSTMAAAPGDEKTAYDDAFAALRDGRYAESARRFSAFLQQYPNGEFADNATYWLGESYYVTQNYQVALDTFSDLLGRFPNSAKAPDAQLKVGYCYYELRDWPRAESALNDVIARYPDTTVARLAQGRLRALRLEGTR